MTDVEKSEILQIWHVCDIENVAMNAKFMQFFAIIHALSCGEKLSPKVHLWRKNDKYEVCVTTPAAPISLVVRAERPKRRWRQTLWTNPEPTWALIMKMKSKVIVFFQPEYSKFFGKPI